MFLTADVTGAKADLLESLTLNPSFTQSLVKLARVHMEEGDKLQATKCLEDAIKVNEGSRSTSRWRERKQRLPLRSPISRSIRAHMRLTLAKHNYCLSKTTPKWQHS